MNLETKQAVRIAKDWLADLYAEEGIAEIGLEEVRIKDRNWEITLGFVRPMANQLLTALQGGYTQTGRLYKVLRVSDIGKQVTEMRNREAA